MAKGHFKWDNSTSSNTYNSWRSMRNRCLFDNHNSKHYKDKGITIHESWVDNFDQFVKDMGHRPDNTTLDRINPDGNYEPSNCRWSDWREQQNNKSTLTQIEHEGCIKTIGEWAYILDLTPTELSKVYKRYSKYKASSFDELFFSGSLLTKRVNERKNLCTVCGKTDSCKWRKFGTLCNNCYHRALRWSKKNQLPIENFPEWENITWPTKHQHLTD